MRLQRYVSPELHHFVGRRCSSDDERYDLLLRILRSGELRPGPAAGYAEAGDGVAMIMKLAPDDTPPGDGRVLLRHPL